MFTVDVSPCPLPHFPLVNPMTEKRHMYNRPLCMLSFQHTAVINEAVFNSTCLCVESCEASSKSYFPLSLRDQPTGSRLTVCDPGHQRVLRNYCVKLGGMKTVFGDPQGSRRWRGDTGLGFSVINLFYLSSDKYFLRRFLFFYRGHKALGKCWNFNSVVESP